MSNAAAAARTYEIRLGFAVYYVKAANREEAVAIAKAKAVQS